MKAMQQSPTVTHLPLYKHVKVELGQPHVRFTGTMTVVPLTWHATGGEELFPRLAGQLELQSVGPDRTQITLLASYRPPLGGVGQLIDRAVLHRVADLTAKDFVDRVCAQLEQRLAK